MVSSHTSRKALLGVGVAHILIILGVLMSACGSTDMGTGGSETGGTVTPTSTPEPNTPPKPRINTPGFADIAGLSIHLEGYSIGQGGTVSHTFTGIGIACGPHLVFAADDPSPANVSPADILAIQTYLLNGGDSHLDTPAPSPLRWISGAQGTCLAQIEITNHSGRDMQVVGMGLQMVGSTQTNDLRYPQVEECTFVGCDRPGEGGACDYTITLQLPASAAGPVPFAPIVSNLEEPSVCPASVVLHDGTTIIAHVSIAPPAGVKRGVYEVVPTLRTDAGSVPLPTLESVLVYADQSQFRCYGLVATSDGHTQVAPEAQLGIHDPLCL